MKKRLLIVDVEDIQAVKPVPGSSKGVDPKNLMSALAARKWLTDPNNWFPESTRIIKWEGLVPRIAAEHGIRLLQNTADDGLPAAVVYAQRQIKSRGIVDETVDLA